MTAKVGMRMSYGIGSGGVPGEGSVLVWPPHHPLSTGPGLQWVHNANSIAVTYATATPDVYGAFAARGFVAHYDDFGGSSAWGNAAARAAFLPAVDDLRTKCDDPIVIAGASMGGIGAAYIAANRGARTIAGIGLGVPVCNVADIHDNNRPSGSGLAATIEAAHGGLSAYQAILSSINPVTLAPSFSTIPVHIWYATDDPVITVPSVEEFAEAHGNTVLHNLGNVGHAIHQQYLDECSVWLRSLI